MRLNITSDGKLVGKSTMVVNTTMSWANIDGNWLITEDKWNFVESKHDHWAERISQFCRFLPSWP